MADNTLGLLVQLILDKGKSAEFKAGMKESADSVEKFEKSISDATDALGDDFVNFTKKFDNSFKIVDGELKNTQTGVRATADELRKFSRINLQAAQEQEEAAGKVAESVKQEQEEIKQLSRTIREMAQISNLSEAEVERLSDELFDSGKRAIEAQKQINIFNKELLQTERRVGDMNQLANSIGQISQGLFLTGSAIVGSIYLSANEEAKRIKEAGGVVDETTQKWLTAQTRIQLSYQRIGKTAMTAFLPVLEKAAALAEKGSKFVESHPDLVRAALNVGGVVATVGAIGMLVSKGIRLYADITMIGAQVKYAASTALFKASVDEFLAGVAGQKVASGAGAVGGIGGTLAKVAPAAGILIAGAFIVELERRGLNKILGSNQSFGDIAETYKKYMTLPLGGLLLTLEKFGLASDETTSTIWNSVKAVLGLDNSVDKLTDGLDDLSGAAEAALDEIEGMKIIRNLEKENLEAEREYSQQRASIMSSSIASMLSSMAQLRQAESRIKGNLSGSLSKLGANFALANKQADAQYQTERANIAREGNEAILEIERNAQEELRKLEEDFAVQKDELTRSRDALGLVKAQREHDRQVDEIEDTKNKETAERRRQTQRQLADLRQSHMQERAERLAKYKQDVADARAQAAQELKEAREAAAQRAVEIFRQRAKELSELQRSYNDERRQRISAAYAQIQDLGNAQNAERVMRARYHAIILAEATAFMSRLTNAYRSRSGSGGSTGTAPSRAAGGYVNGGLYNLHPNEFVLSPSTTAAAESLIGSQLSQQALLMAMAGGGRASLTLNDARRFDSSIPLAERRAIEQEGAALAMETFAGLLKR